MPKISGVDFSELYAFRDSVSIVMMDESVVELPLLPVKYATEAMAFMHRNDILAARYSVLQAKLSLKAKALEELKTQLGDDPEKLDELKQDESLDMFESTYKAMDELQAKSAELCKESHVLCEEIIEFLRPHLSVDVINQLVDLDDVCTVKVLELMTYGDAAIVNKDEVQEEAEDPSIQASQSS